MSNKLGFLIYNFLGLQITWAACAYGATHSQPMLGVIVGVIYLIFHFSFTPTRRNDILTMCCLATFGIAMDYINMRIGIISFSDTSESNFIPLWLITLWCVFSLMIPHSLHWLSKKPLLAFMLGGLGGSSSYWLGHKLGAIMLSQPLTMSVAVYFIEWAFYIVIAYSIFRIISKTSSSNHLHQT